MAEEPLSARRSVARKIGRYDVVGPLAVGGMAEIVLGRITGPMGFERAVVIKRILPHLAHREDFVAMFLDEARIVAGIRHTNVVQVHELGHEDDDLFLVMEYLEGETAAGLQRRLRATGQKLSPALAAYIVAEAAAGLHAAHELRGPDGELLNVVHRDVSPQNLFVTYEGEVKVLDFGIATAADRVARTEAGQFKGKFDYSSPEQCLGKAIDRRSDVFALGIVAYELATGTRLFQRSNELFTMRAIIEGKVMPPTSVVPDFPGELSGVIMRALTRSRDSRTPTAHEMRRDLLAFIRQSEPDVDPREELAGLMKRCFAERIEAKRDMLRRMRESTSIGEIPSIETDKEIVLPIAFEDPAEGASMIQSVPPAPSTIKPSAALPRWALVVMALGGLALLGTGLMLLRAKRAVQVTDVPPAASSVSTIPSAMTSATTSAAASASTAPTASVPAPPASVVVHVDSTPPGAHVFVGGSDRGSAPLDVKLARGSTPIEIELRRDGYAPLREKVVPDVDQRLRLNMTALPTGGPRPTSSAQPYRRFD